MTLGGTSAAYAEPVRIHVEGGAAHAISGEQASEFGGGGEGKATVEVAPISRIGFQAGAGAIFLSKGDAATDRTLASTSTGTAFLGTLGMRLRAFGADRPGGLWVDGNFGVSRTGDATRPAFDSHIGWDVRATEDSRLDVGPYLGYTQIFQTDNALRTSDARMVTLGIQIGLGSPNPPRRPEPKHEAKKKHHVEPKVELVEVDHDRDGDLEASDGCPNDAPAWEDGCVGEMHIFENKIYLDDIIHFDFGKAKVRAESFRVVKKLAAFINEHTEITDVQIEGHADEVGGDNVNQALSVDRATAMRELLTWFGAPPARLHIVGFGKTRPKVVTQRPEQQNRRVELFVTTVVKSNQPLDRKSGTAANASHGKNSQ